MTPPALGGILIAANIFNLGWRSVFLINLPVIIIAIPAALQLLRENKAEHANRLDIPGAIILAAGLLSLIIPLIEGREHDWPWWTWILLILVSPLLGIFWRYENRIEQAGGTPLIVPSLLRSRGLQRSLIATFFFYTIVAFFLIFAMYEQIGLRHDALTTGLAILPLGIGLLLGPLCGPSITQHFQTRTAAIGLGLEILGLLLTATLATMSQSSYLWISLFITGLGQGIAFPALVHLNIDQVVTQWAGLAAGLVNSTLQISAAVSVAVIGGFFFTLAPTGTNPHTTQSAFTTSTVLIAISLGLATLLTHKKQLKH